MFIFALPPVVKFTNILRAPIPPIFLHQKIKSTISSTKKMHLLYGNADHKMLVKLPPVAISANIFDATPESNANHFAIVAGTLFLFYLVCGLWSVRFNIFFQLTYIRVVICNIKAERAFKLCDEFVTKKICTNV